MSSNTTLPGKLVGRGYVKFTEEIVPNNRFALDKNSFFYSNNKVLSPREIEFLDPVQLRNSVKEGSDKLNKFLDSRGIESYSILDAVAVDNVSEYGQYFETDLFGGIENVLKMQFKLLDTATSSQRQWRDDTQHVYSSMVNNIIPPIRIRKLSRNLKTPTKETQVGPDVNKKVANRKNNGAESNPNPSAKKTATPTRILIPPRIPKAAPSAFVEALNAPVPKKIKKHRKINIASDDVPSISNDATLNNYMDMNCDAAPSYVPNEPIVSPIGPNLSDEVSLAASHIEACASPISDNSDNRSGACDSEPVIYEETLKELDPCTMSSGAVERLLQDNDDNLAEPVEDPVDEEIENKESMVTSEEQPARFDLNLCIENEVADNDGFRRLNIKPEPVCDYTKKRSETNADDDGDSDREDYRSDYNTTKGKIEEIVLSSDSEIDFDDDDDIDIVYEQIGKPSLDNGKFIGGSSTKAAPLKTSCIATPKKPAGPIRKVLPSESREEKLQRIYKQMGIKEFETNFYLHMEGYTTAAEQLADNATGQMDTNCERILQNKLARQPIGSLKNIPVFRAGNSVSLLKYPYNQKSGAFWPVVQPFDGIDVYNPKRIVRSEADFQLSNMSCYSNEGQKWFLCSNDPARWDESYQKAAKMNDQQMKENGRFKHRIGYKKVSKVINLEAARLQDRIHQDMERKFYEMKDCEEIYEMTREETKEIRQNETRCQSNKMVDHVRSNLTDVYSKTASDGEENRQLTTPEYWLSVPVKELASYVSAHDKKWILHKYTNDCNEPVHRWMQQQDFPNTKHSIIIVRGAFRAAFAYQWNNRACLCNPGEEPRRSIKERQNKLMNSFKKKMRHPNTISLIQMRKQFKLLKFEFPFWTLIWDSCVSYCRGYPSISFLLPLLQPHIDTTFKSVVRLTNRQIYGKQFMLQKKMLNGEWDISRLEEERARALEMERNSAE